MTVINVLVYEEDGSSFYRLLEPARVMKAAGYDVEVYRFGIDSTEPIQVRGADVYVMNRPIRVHQAELAKQIVLNGGRVIVDMDDDFHGMVPEHSMYGGPGFVRTGLGDLDLSYMLDACTGATTVTVTTPALADRYGFGHGVVIPNHIPASYLDVTRPEEHDGLWVGWFGTVASHPNDLQASNGGVARALAKVPGATLAVLGSPREVPIIKSHLRVPPNDPTYYSGFCHISRLPEYLVRYDVGIVPLQDCQFNQAKSWLKGLEFSAVGVPWVASPTADYRRLHNLGAGLLANTRNEWSRHIQELLKSADYRAQIGGKSKEVAADWTFEGNVERWANVWT